MKLRLEAEGGGKGMLEAKALCQRLEVKVCRVLVRGVSRMSMTRWGFEGDANI